MDDFRYFLLDPALKDFYRTARKALSAFDRRIPLPGLSPEEVSAVFRAVLTDAPELFWFGGEWQSAAEGRQVFALPRYTFDRAGAREAQLRLERAAAECLRSLPDTGDVCSRILWLCDWLMAHVAYAGSAAAGQTAYDALAGRSAVCKGISKALQYLLRQSGCFATLREGTLDGAARHVWNVVAAEGQFYNADVTMGYPQFSFLFHGAAGDDPHRCLLISDERILRTHRIFDPLPSVLPCSRDYRGG